MKCRYWFVLYLSALQCHYKISIFANLIEATSYQINKLFQVRLCQMPCGSHTANVIELLLWKNLIYSGKWYFLTYLLFLNKIQPKVKTKLFTTLQRVMMVCIKWIEKMIGVCKISEYVRIWMNRERIKFFSVLKVDDQSEPGLSSILSTENLFLG